MLSRRSLFSVLRRKPSVQAVLGKFDNGTVREATPDDCERLLALWRNLMEFHREIHPAFAFSKDADTAVVRHMLETMKSDDAKLYVAEVDGVIIGYIQAEIQSRMPYFPKGKYGFVADIFVSDEFRRFGAGRALFCIVRNWLYSRDVTTIELFVLESNPVSNGFWQSMGFDPYLRLLRADLER